MPELTLITDHYPNAIPPNAQVGDTISLDITGVIYRVEDDLVDVTPYGSPTTQHLRGNRSITITITEVEQTHYDALQDALQEASP
jgi:hypothetical protein